MIAVLKHLGKLLMSGISIQFHDMRAFWNYHHEPTKLFESSDDFQRLLNALSSESEEEQRITTTVLAQWSTVSAAEIEQALAAYVPSASVPPQYEAMEMAPADWRARDTKNSP
jgi:hypothetical protein